MACKPATPAPSTSTRAAVMVPAAVISMGKIFGSASAPSNTAAISGDGGHGRQCVHALRARDARHQLHREKRNTGPRQVRHFANSRERLAEANDDLSWPQQRQVRSPLLRIDAQCAHLYNDVGLLENVGARGRHVRREPHIDRLETPRWRPPIVLP